MTMKKMTMALLIFVLIGFLTAFSESKMEREKIPLIEFHKLESKKALIERGEAQANEDYRNLIKKADSALESRLFSVVKKKGTPPSGDKHDYMSIGPYWWPNPNTSNKLPYIRKDGEINPESRNDYTDFVEVEAFFKAITNLRDAYYFSDNKAYAKKALQLIKAWFIDEETKMNPNVNYGQSIPGIVDGRKFAIIEFEYMPEVLKCLELLKKRNLLDGQTEKAMKNWLTEYAYWLQNSENGKGEANTKNNHGTYYDMQLLSILTYLGRIEEVKEHLTTITKNRIFSQIEPDGSQPRELARTKSFSYSVMNLHAFLYLARLGQKVDVDIWGMESEDGRSIKKGYEYLLPYLTQNKIWKYKQIVNADDYTKKLISDLKYACRIFNNCTTFEKTLQKIKDKDVLVRFIDYPKTF